jgi:hypothetical protein
VLRRELLLLRGNWYRGCRKTWLRDAKLHGWKPSARNCQREEQKFTVEWKPCGTLTSNWPLSDALAVFNNARIDNQELHFAILNSKPRYLMCFKCVDNQELHFAILNSKPRYLMCFKCAIFNSCRPNWVETDEGYQLEALIVNANFTPNTLIVLRKENSEFHQCCFEELVRCFDTLKTKTGLHHEVSSLMMKAVGDKCVPNDSILSMKDIILETVKNIYSTKFPDISTFVFYGSALLLWLITYEILSLLVTFDPIAAPF